METAQTADYALLVLIELQQRDGQSISELAARLELNRSVVQRIVVTLHRRAMIIKGAKGRYFLGPRLITIAQDIPHELAKFARPYVRDLAESAGEVAVLSAPEGDEVVFVITMQGNRGPLRVEYATGARHPIKLGANGLAVLAFRGQHSMDTPSPELEARLNEIRRQGYAVTEGEVNPDLTGVAAPVIAGDFGVVGSLAVVMPLIRRDKVAGHTTELVVSAARRLGGAYARHLSERTDTKSKQLASA